MKIRSLELRSVLLNIQWDRIAMVMTAMFVLPFLVHLIPLGLPVPWGVVFLPIFYAPLLAVVLCKRHVAWIAAVLSPTVNMFLVGRPDPVMARILTLELVVFVLVADFLQRKSVRSWTVGVFSVCFAKFCSWAVLKTFFAMKLINFEGIPLTVALSYAFPGLCVLLVINFMALLYKKA